MKTPIIITDFDGTLFEPNWRAVCAPWYTIRIGKRIRSAHIPFIISTGRIQWGTAETLILRLLGLPDPEMLILGAGTKLLFKTENGYREDREWTKRLEQEKTSFMHIETLSKKLYEVLDYADTNTHVVQLPFLIRLPLINKQVLEVEKLLGKIGSSNFKGIKGVLAERRSQKNTASRFSGYLIVVPEIAGKDGILTQYLFEKLHDRYPYGSYLLFGDGAIDSGMLSLKNAAITSFAVSATPILKKLLSKDNNVLFKNSGPKTMYQQLEKWNPSSFSPAQNNPLRKLIRVFDPLFNSLADPRFTPNEVSLHGITLIDRSLAILSQSPSFFQKLTALWLFFKGILMDVVDGVRARNSGRTQENGQLIDAFSDRVKEFKPLYARAKNRLLHNPDDAYETLIAAISCILPSLARAQVEEMGIHVPEYDKNGGSMLSRSKNLIISQLCDTFGWKEQSLQIDKQLQKANIKTFLYRLTYLSKPRTAPLDELKAKAKIRKILFKKILIEEDKAVQNLLKYDKIQLQKYHDFCSEYFKTLQLDEKNEIPDSEIQTLFPIQF
ncbi:hypothetical protein HGA88_05540 [Candidatus Roizmanbacteria bacterium]|nr:hypothetical protein [Candidatus Roizmanbacteria bacterium]